jgi:outer membrane biosynthesis protein TonB
MECPSPEYCDNIIRQVNRYFRAPAGIGAAEADIYFVINRDGSVSELRLIGSSGGAAFRMAVLEGVEQAGLQRAFGRLPDAYGADRLPVSFYFRPAR